MVIFYIALLCWIISQTEGKCEQLITYDVTRWPLFVDSHEHLDRYDYYDPNERRCMWVFTNKTNHMIKLEPYFFALSDWDTQCYMDYLRIYDSHDFSNEIGRYCEKDGPGWINSTGQNLFLYFETDNIYEDLGFRFEATSRESSNQASTPSPAKNGLSGSAIAGVVIAVVLATTACSVLVTLLVVYKTKPKVLLQQPQPRLTDPDAHVYAIPQRVPSVADNSSFENTRNLAIATSSQNYQGGASVDSFDSDFDEEPLRDYRGYDLPAYIATIGNTNGPPTAQERTNRLQQMIMHNPGYQDRQYPGGNQIGTGTYLVTTSGSVPQTDLGHRPQSSIS